MIMIMIMQAMAKALTQCVSRTGQGCTAAQPLGSPLIPPSALQFGGTSPSSPTETEVAVTVPSAARVPFSTICAPGTSRLRVPGAKVTMGTSSGTTICFSPVPYFTVMSRLSRARDALRLHMEGRERQPLRRLK
ncbi:MAG: hypothetical protein JWP20_688 [Roseomonas sp.]|nr:hypothetical protein [Roseomonas sp.]